jgi:hypothetical protein
LIPGRADIGTREIIDFASFDAPELLSEAFAQAITRRWEGSVDAADFAIVGGHRELLNWLFPELVPKIHPQSDKVWLPSNATLVC